MENRSYLLYSWHVERSVDRGSSRRSSLKGTREGHRQEALDDLPWKDERGPSSLGQTLEPFQRQRWGNFWETGWSTYGLFQAHRYHLELNWTAMWWRPSAGCPVWLSSTLTRGQKWRQRLWRHGTGSVPRLTGQFWTWWQSFGSLSLYLPLSVSVSVSVSLSLSGSEVICSAS